MPILSDRIHNGSLKGIEQKILEEMIEQLLSMKKAVHQEAARRSKPS